MTRAHDVLASREVRAGTGTVGPMGGSPQTLSLERRRCLAAWAAACAEHVLPIYEAAVPGDARVRDTIDQARTFSSGDLPVADAIRRRGGEAGAAARNAPTPDARAAAYAAEQAAAVAHMGAHALGAAGYAAKATALASGVDETLSEVRWQLAAMDDAVAAALVLLPPLGEHRGGPLGPGRLSGGLVGQAIRELQADLHQQEA